jgi:biotin carboxyl carrier protein
MQWKVQISGADRLITLPDQIPDNVPFDVSLDGHVVKARWQRSTRALFILDDRSASAWTSINLRTRSVTKFSGESDLSVGCEFVPAGAKGPIIMDATVALHVPGQEAREAAATKKPKVVRSQITGKVLKVLIKSGDSVNVGDTLLIIEAMKMENRVQAIAAGTIESVKVSEGDTVASGAELARYKQG